ncbi:restriction endonuclease subunit S [Halobacteriovorax marinus]|uniref:restriction endonuclease subunit S n=1 Tax=Halobacteriovorax marinus TaxID=97084 RepID=UPI003A90CB56
MNNYDEYKSTGIEWLGDIPKEWELVQLRRIAEVGTGSKDTENKVDEGKYPFYVRSQTVERINSYTFDGEAILTAGDGVGVGKVFHYVNGKFDYHQRVYAITNMKKVIGKYLFYYIRQNFKYEVLKVSAKSTVDSLRLPMFQEFPVCIPSLGEQKAIISYLENELDSIERVIALKKELISLLKEKKQVLIDKAVTSGFSDTTYKASGIQWVEKIPSEWDKARFKDHVFFKEGPGILGKDFKEEGTPLIRISNVKSSSVEGPFKQFLNSKLTSKYKDYKVKIGDVLISGSASTGIMSSVEDKSIVGSIPYTGLFIIRVVSKKLDLGFLKLFLTSYLFEEQIKQLQTGSTIQHFGPTHLNQMFIFIPPIGKQNEIVKYVSEQINKLDSIIEKAEVGLSLLKEKKKSVVSNVVSGKIKVF